MERLDEDDDITEEEHVSHALQRFAAGGHPRSDSPDGTVPTEYLQQDHDETLELPAHQDQRPGACFLCMAAFPVVTLLAIVALSFGAGLWVLATPAERFSVDDALFTDASNRDCILFRLQRSGELFQHSASAYMQPSPRRALASLAPPADQPRQPSPLSGEPRRRRRRPRHPRVRRTSSPHAAPRLRFRAQPVGHASPRLAPPRLLASLLLRLVQLQPPAAQFSVARPHGSPRRVDPRASRHITSCITLMFSDTALHRSILEPRALAQARLPRAAALFRDPSGTLPGPFQDPSASLLA